MTKLQAQPNKRLHIGTISLSLTMAVVLLIELFLSKSGKSLCGTAACELISKYVRIGEPLLLAIGACFFIMLAASIFFAKRYPGKTCVTLVPLLLLVCGASFDGALIGFQYVTLGQKCIICLLVASALAAVSLLYSGSMRKCSIFILTISVWLAGFAAHATLIMPDVAPTGSQMFFYERPAAKDIKNPATATFIFGINCPHCSEVLAYLADSNPNKMKWRFAIIDKDKVTINKLGTFYDKAANADNPFQLLLDSKKEKSTLAPEILAKLPDLTRQTRIFLANNKINVVPLLVVDDGKNTTTFYKGSKTILEYLNAQ